MEIILRGRPIVSGNASGVALVSTKPLSFLGGIDPKTGVIIERNNELFGKTIKDSILFFPHGHGSTVGSFILYALAKNGLAPKAIVNTLADPVVVVGAVIANIPMIDRVDISQVKTGDLVEVNGCSGIIRVLRR